MKLIYGGVPYNTAKVNHYEKNTNDATTVPSAVQVGLTYYANGQKQTGTGKSFEFATYGATTTNMMEFVPISINVVEIACLEHPLRSVIGFDEITSVDFTTEQTVGFILIDNIEYPITVKIEGNILTFNCEKEVTLQFFYGKDNYI